MDNFLLKTKKVLSICMETTAGGRNYSGGLGALYGDTTRTMDRMGAAYIAVTPIYKNGYVAQTVTDNGVVDNYPEQDFNVDYEDTGKILSIPLLHREIKVKVWKHRTLGNAYGLDSFVPENGELAYITNNLYGENGIGIYEGEEQRLMQEVIAGVGAVKFAKEIGYDFDIVHLNEGHGVFASLYMISEFKDQGMSFEEAWEEVRKRTVFTTHTPIAAGNKSRPIQMILDLGANCNLSYDELRAIGSDDTGVNFGSTTASLRVSKMANAVALRHQFTSHELWKNVSNSCPIDYIDNGVDIEFWQDKNIREAYEKMDYAGLMEAHKSNKRILIEEIGRRNGVHMNENSLLIGFARRFIAYKRADLIFEDLARFEKMIREHNVQIVFSGKAHPKDWGSKQHIIMRIYEMSKRYPKNVVFLQNYNVEIAGFMTKGCDVWMGYPEIPLEACSTSGMKAAANGLLNLSTADGWWHKSARYDVNGWIIGETKSHDKWTDAQFLYKVLEEKVIPAFYDKEAWVRKMYASIYTALEECSTERMCRDYYVYLYNA